MAAFVGLAGLGTAWWVRGQLGMMVWAALIRSLAPGPSRCGLSVGPRAPYDCAEVIGCLALAGSGAAPTTSMLP